MRISGMLANLAYDYPLDNGFAITFGSGLGWGSVAPRIAASANVQVNPLISASSPAAAVTTFPIEVARHIDTVFAWQVLIGLSYSVRSDLDLQLDYRYSGIDQSNHSSAYANTSAEATKLQAVVLSVRWYPWGGN